MSGAVKAGAVMAKKMTPAEKAYAATLRYIAREQKKGATTLRFDSDAYRALDRLPPELRDFPGLTRLDLNQTAITDLAPLQGMTGLQMLDLSRTAITNFAPLQGITGLKILSLNQTAITDLAPLQDLTGLQGLLLNQTAITDLAPLQDLTGLQALYLNQTAITDLAPLQGMTGLQFLSLDQTVITDFSPLQGMIGLRRLYLGQTANTDLAFLRGMTELQTLGLTGTKVRDLRPIIGLSALSKGQFGGVHFADTPATERDPQLQALSLIEDDQQRTRDTIAYLKTLPPWPEPLPLEAGDDPAPVVPQNVPAPLQIIERDGVLHTVLPGDALDDRGAVLARQGWAALRDYLADLADIKPRIENQIPGLSRALARFETALSDSYEQVNSVALGTHGQRVIRLAETAGETMSDADAAELQEFAVAVALFLERFPDWRAYRTAALTRPIDAKRVAETLPAIREIETLLIDQIGVDPAIPRTLRDLENASAEMPDDKITSHGLLDSVVNVVAAMGTVLWSGIKATGRGSKWFMQTFANKLAEKSAEKLVDLVTSKPVLLVAADLFINNARALKALAAAFPDQFSWVIGLLRAIGLG
jgi:Leucine-rich repeat (LRR) protein